MMQRAVFWVLAAAVIALTGATRFDTRSARLDTDANDRLVPMLEHMLSADGFEVLGAITDPDIDNIIIGFEFTAPRCAAPMRAVELPITGLSRTFVEDYVNDGETAAFIYYGEVNDGRSRGRMTYLRLKTMIAAPLGIGDLRASRQHLAIVRSETCALPQVAWRRLWMTGGAS